jgi:hypothetical protein
MHYRFLCNITVLALFAGSAFAGSNEIGETQVPEVTSTYVLPQVTSGDCNCIDLTFVIDDTGSMGGSIANVAAEIGNLLTLAQNTCTDVHAALVTFKDNTQVDHDLDGDTGGVAAAITALLATSGSGEPEASDDALREISTEATCAGDVGDFTTANWRSDCCKLAILVTDARPAGSNCNDFYDGLATDGADMSAAAAACAALGVQVGTVFVPSFGDPGDIATILSGVASTTGGIYAQVASDGTGTAAAMEQMILECSGAAATELCCLPGATCVDVLEGTCTALGGYIVNDCVECNVVSVESDSWGSVKALYRK